MPPVFDREKCAGCGICADVCPEDVIFMADKDEIPKILYPDECWHCAACVIDCPKQAVRLYIPLPMRLYKKKECEIPCID